MDRIPTSVESTDVEHVIRTAECLRDREVIKLPAIFTVSAPVIDPLARIHIQLHTRHFLAAVFVLGLAPAALAANSPCSGKKGGVAGCQGSTFICNDGSVSASKRSCSTEMGAAGLIEMVPAAAGECSCRSGAFCTGRRGGRYCITDSGGKSYLKK